MMGGASAHGSSTLTVQQGIMSSCLLLFPADQDEQQPRVTSDLTSAPSPSRASGLLRPQPPACSGWPQWPCTIGAVYSQRSLTPKRQQQTACQERAQQRPMPHNWSSHGATCTNNQHY